MENVGDRIKAITYARGTYRLEENSLDQGALIVCRYLENRQTEKSSKQTGKSRTNSISKSTTAGKKFRNRIARFAEYSQNVMLMKTIV